MKVFPRQEWTTNDGNEHANLTKPQQKKSFDATKSNILPETVGLHTKNSLRKEVHAVIIETTIPTNCNGKGPFSVQTQDNLSCNQNKLLFDANTAQVLSINNTRRRTSI